MPGRGYAPGFVRAAWAFAAAGFRRYAQYRAATAAGAFTNAVFGLLRASILTAAVASAGGRLGGYDSAGVATYAWLTQAVLATVHVFAWTELADRVRTGDVAVDLARPVDLQWQLLAADLGRAAYVLVPRALPPLLVGALTFGLRLPGAPASYALGFLALLLAVAISFAGRFLLNLAAFWLLDLRGPLTVYVIVSNLLCGLVVPVHWFPPWLAAVAAATPFPSMVQTPVDILSGRISGFAAVHAVALAAGWLLLALLAGRGVLARATRRVVVQGG